MPKFFFHFATPADYFEDNIGSDLEDLAAVHSRAARLVFCVMRWSRLGASRPDFRRWIVTVTDERRRPVMNMIFPLSIVPKTGKPTTIRDARALLLALDAKLGSGERSPRAKPVSA